MGDRRTWTHQEVVNFIDVVKECRLVEESDSTRCRNADIYKLIHEKMKERGHEFTVDQLRRKWRSLKDSHNKISGGLNKSGNSSKDLSWVYYTSMHEILGSRPRALSSQDGYGIESGQSPPAPEKEPMEESDKAPSPSELTEDRNDNQVYSSMAHQNPVNHEAVTMLITVEDPSDGGSSGVMPETDSDTSSNSQRLVHGQSSSARRRRSRQPYPQENDVQSILQCIRKVNQQQMQLFRESEERYFQSEERHFQRSSDLEHVICSTLQTLSNVAVALMSANNNGDGTQN